MEDFYKCKNIVIEQRIEMCLKNENYPLKTYFLKTPHKPKNHV